MVPESPRPGDARARAHAILQNPACRRIRCYEYSTTFIIPRDGRKSETRSSVPATRESRWCIGSSRPDRAGVASPGRANRNSGRARRGIVRENQLFEHTPRPHPRALHRLQLISNRCSSVHRDRERGSRNSVRMIRSLLRRASQAANLNATASSRWRGRRRTTEASVERRKGGRDPVLVHQVSGKVFPIAAEGQLTVGRASDKTQLQPELDMSELDPESYVEPASRASRQSRRRAICPRRERGAERDIRQRTACRFRRNSLEAGRPNLVRVGGNGGPLRLTRPARCMARDVDCSPLDPHVVE